MSETTKKRSRKSKPLPRMYVDLENLDKTSKVQPAKRKATEGASTSKRTAQKAIDFPGPIPALHVKVEVHSGDEAEDDWWKTLEKEANQESDQPTIKPDPDEIDEESVPWNNKFDKLNKNRAILTYSKRAAQPTIKPDPDGNDEPNQWNTRNGVEFNNRSAKVTYNQVIDQPTIKPDPDTIDEEPVQWNTTNNADIFKQGSANKTYRFLAPKFKHDNIDAAASSDSNEHIRQLNDTSVKYKLDAYTEQTNQAMSVCLKALKLRGPTGYFHYECLSCMCIYFKRNDFIVHINDKHSGRTNAVTILANLSRTRVSLVAKVIHKSNVLKEKSAKLNSKPEQKVNLESILAAVTRAHKFKKTSPYKILSFKCYACHKSWEHYSPFREHLQVSPENHTDLAFAVEEIFSDHIHISAKRNTDQPNYELPLYSETDFELEIFKCCKCQTVFKDSAEMDIHKMQLAICSGCQMADACQIIKLHEGSCSKFFVNFFPKTCECGQALGDNAAMTEHSKTCKNGKTVLAFNCGVCSYTSPSLDILNQHQIVFHDVRSDQFMIQFLRKCPLCGKSYPGIRDAHSCTKTHNSLRCVCGKLCVNKVLLNCHLMAYRGSEKCPTSGKWVKYGCLSKDSLANDPDRQLSFLCNMCHEIFVDELLVSKHIMEKHTEKSRKGVLFCYEKIYPQKNFVSIIDGRCFINDEQKTGEQVLLQNTETLQYESESTDSIDNIKIDNDISILEEAEICQEPANILLQQLEPSIDTKEDNAMESVIIENNIDIKEEKFDPDIDIVENAPGTLSEPNPQTATKDLAELSNVFVPTMKLGTAQTAIEKDCEPIFVKSEPNEDEEEDIIILQEVDDYTDTTVKTETIDDSEQTIDQFIENNSEITMMEVSAEALFEENFAIRNKPNQRRIYFCTKCDFSGIHKYYREHLDACLKVNPRRKNALGQRRFTPKRTPPIEIPRCFPCSKCNTKFDDLKCYLNHLPQHGIRPNTCPKCKFIETSIGKLKLHILRHLRTDFVRVCIINREADSFSNTLNVKHCNKCREVIESLNFWKHWESHLKSGEEVYIQKEADLCDQSLSNPDYTLPTELLKHLIETLIQEVPDKKRIFDFRECPVCDNRRFNRINDFKRHLIEHLKKDALGKKVVYGFVRCQICSADFGSSDAFKKHVREHASLPLYQCHMCNKSFSDSSNFAKHQKVHNLRVLFCDICKKKFQSKCMLEKHILLHSLTPLKCEVCSKEFVYTSEFNRHMKSKHNVLPQEYGCKICKKKFLKFKDKWDHEWEVHKERNKKVDCPICGQGFRKNSDLKRHLKTRHQANVQVHSFKYNKKIEQTVQS